VQELGELDDADDGQDQRQPEARADGPDLHLPEQDEGEDRDPDHNSQQRHGRRAKPVHNPGDLDRRLK